MIESNIKLNTWLDVQECFQLSKSEGNWPNIVVSVTCYWDEILIHYTEGQVAAINHWLENLFSPRLSTEPNIAIILADDVTAINVVLSLIEIVDISRPPIIRPSITSSTTIFRDETKPAILDRELKIPITAFHSFKGGVGRTMHALAMAKSLSERNKKVLLIDGDFEAPGITYLVRDSINVDYSYADLLASLHSDPSEGFATSKAFAVKSLANQKLDNIILLPSFRNDYQQRNFEIKPEHIIQNISDGFIVPEIIAEIGFSLGVDLVIIDLRAGLSELSTGILFDPRVDRYLVSSINAQSTEGTKLLLDIIKRFTNSIGYPLPQLKLILNNISELYLADKSRLDELKNELTNKYFGEINESSLDSIYDIDFIESVFNQELLSMSNNFKEYFDRLEKTGIDTHFKSVLADATQLVPLSGIDEKRKVLSEKAEAMIFAERGTVENILWTQPLRRLAESYNTKLPNVVVSGPKGSGKTLIFTYLAKSKYWKQFLRNGNYECDYDSIILPVLRPASLSDQALDDFKNLKNEVSNYLGISGANVDARDYIESYYSKNLSIQEWTKVWINAIAIASNFKTTGNQQDIGEEFLRFLRDNNKKVIALFDGLEDLFLNINDISKQYQRDVLAALLQRVPDYLGQQPGTPLGIIILIRQDYIDYSITQNTAQFTDRYKKFQLKWNVDEALKLVWHVSNDVINDTTGHDKTREETIQALIPLWGIKLGADNSKEARSANWILTALSDWNGQIQARDLIRFLHEAAKNSYKHPDSHDRILVVSAVKSAVDACSEAKVAEVSQENLILDEVFRLLRQTAEKKTPFSSSEHLLTPENLKTLEENGILFKEVSKQSGEQFHIAEIYRQGLGFSYKGRKMTKMLAFRRAIDN